MDTEQQDDDGTITDTSIQTENEENSPEMTFAQLTTDVLEETEKNDLAMLNGLLNTPPGP